MNEQSHRATKRPGSEIKILEQAFIDGFQAADDPQAFLRLSRIPMHLHGLADEKRDTSYLVDVRIETACEVGTASRGFATTDLMYHPLPREMTKRRQCVVFVYIGNEGTHEIGFAELMGAPKPAGGHLDRNQHQHKHHH